MIVAASNRTDLPAYYMDWFMNRLKEGFFDVRNPFYPKQVSRIRMENVDAFMICTKNPLPLLPHVDEIPVPMMIDVTITGYHSDLEPNVPDKKKVVEAVCQLAEKLGKDHVCVRYDPIILNDRYTVDYHLRAFEKLCTLLEGSVSQITFSFLDHYKNVRRHQKELREHSPTEKEMEILAKGFAESAKIHNIRVFTCHEKGILARWGIDEGSCFSRELAYLWTGKKFGSWKARDCACVAMADIGVYNSCGHFCRYCYANYDEKQIAANIRNHDPSSSLLIGHLEEEDIIKERMK